LINNKKGYITSGEEQLHYLQWGTGPRLLLAFHGYETDAWIFQDFVPHLVAEYTIIAIDLPHHGHTKWPGQKAWQTADLLATVRELMKLHHVEKVSLLGYSIGGRVCLSVLEGMPVSIDKVLLMATDGLAINFYFNFFTRTILGRKMFSHMLGKPDGYLALVDWMKKNKLVHESRHKFVMHFLQNEQKRKILLNAWPAMRDLMPEPNLVRKLIKKHHIPVSIFMGEYDKVMPPALAHRFAEGLDTVQVHVLNKGHHIFDHENAGLMAAHLL